jgi:hypothetical protein
VNLLQASIPWPPPNAGLRPVGWAGLLLNAPASYHPYKIDAAAASGRIVLADDERPRLDLSWEVMRKRRIDPEALVRERFGKKPAGKLDKLRAAGGATAWVMRDPTRDRDRAVAYFPATGRVVEALYTHGSERENRIIREATLAGMVDQPEDRPQRWSFFDTSFIAPAGYRYGDSTLNLGDMGVTLFTGGQEFSAPSLMIRQVYPATLALARRPLAGWHEEAVRALRHLYADDAAGWLRRRKPRAEAVETARGKGWTTAAVLRPTLRPFYWRTPRHVRFWTLHDEPLDRLHLLRATGAPAELEPLFESLVPCVQWASPHTGASVV